MEESENRLPFKFSNTRQERIYRRLKLVGAGPPKYFKDACRLRDTKPLFEATTHLIGHLIREIESSLRDVLLVFAETDEKPKSNSHDWEIRQILKGLEIPEDNRIAVLWLNNATSLAHGRAHRDNLQPPRPVDQEFQRFLDEMESIFDVVLSSFESKYLRVHAALDAKLLIEKPTRADAKWLKVNVPNNQAAFGYFFDRLNNPAWLAHLMAERLFDRPPEPIYDPDKNSTFFPPWPLSRYLVRMAGTELEDVKLQVGEILLGLESTNFMVHLDIVDAACLLPIDLAAEIAKKETSWLQEQQFIGHLIPDKFARLVAYLADGNRSDCALAVASAALGFVTTEVQELSATENYFGAEPKTRMDRWDYGRFIDRCWPNLAHASWKGSLRLFSELLDEYLRRKHPERIESSESFSHIWHRAIENDQDGLPNHLISTIRRIAELSVSTDSSRLPDIIEILESHRWDVFERIVLHLLRLNPTEAHKLTVNRLLSEEHFNNLDLFHEYVLLLAVYFTDLDMGQQRTILDWIDNSTPSIGEVKRRRLDWDGTQLSDEDADKSIRLRKLKWLEPLKAVLPQEWKQKYDVWTAELGHLDHPSYVTGEPRIVWGRGLSASEVLSRLSSVEEIVAYLSKPAAERRESTQELSRELSKLVEADVNRFLSEADRFQGLAPIYVRGYLSGVQSRKQSFPESAWPNLFSLINWVVKQPATEADISDNSYDPLDTDWVHTREVIGDFFSSILSREDPQIPISLREEISPIVRELTDDPNPTREYEEQHGGANMDPLTLSLNTIRGNAFHTLFRYLDWCREQLNIGGGLESTPEVREILERHLELEADCSLAVRAVYGERLPYLVSIDPDWVRENVSKILPVENGLSDIRKAVWETFIIYTRPWDNVFDVLYDEYAHAIERLGAKSLYRSESSANHLAEHLVVFYARGKIGLDDGDLLDKFYAHASDRLAGHVFLFIGRILKDGDVPQEVLERFRNLAELRIAVGHAHPAEIEAFGWLFISGRFDPEWSLLRLKDALQISPSTDPDHSVIEALSELAPDFPRIVIECVTLLVDGADTGWKIQYWCPHIRAAIKSALENGETYLARVLVNKLAARGFVDFRDLLS